VTADCGERWNRMLEMSSSGSLNNEFVGIDVNVDASNTVDPMIKLSVGTRPI